jgi:hypothetical protein
MATVYEPITKCPKCGSGVYDNRGSEKSPKSPQFKCKSKECAEAFWLKSPEDGAAKAPAKAQSRPHTQITVGMLADKMDEAYKALELAGFGVDLITLETCYKMAFTELKGQAGG